MIPLHPDLEVSSRCPRCDQLLTVQGWLIPGMRNVVDLRCGHCHREFYGDLPAGHGLCYPMLLDKTSGRVYGRWRAPWFADWLRLSYARRCADPVAFHVEARRTICHAILLNCLDRLYGHSLLKLLNAQHYVDHRPDADLVVMVPRALRWLVPDGVAEVWTVDLPLSRGAEWNDWLAQEIRRRVSAWESCALSVAFSHPHPEDITIERFSRVKPFPLEEWDARLRQPVVTFVSREDRLWAPRPSSSWSRRFQQGINRLRRVLKKPIVGAGTQTAAVIGMAQRLRQRYPALDLAVAGIGKRGGLPSWIRDLRVLEPDAAQERILCERYARSHVVIGVHGSNMLLPSAHAGAAVELVPEDRWGNLVQDLLIRSDDQRDTLFRYRPLPIATSAETVADVTQSLLMDRAAMRLHMRREWCTHGSARPAGAWQQEQERWRRERVEGHEVSHS